MTPENIGQSVRPSRSKAPRSFCTLRSWLSQWSYDDTNASGLGNAARISCPVLVINNTADLACTPSHAQRLFEAVGHADKEYADVAGADHYYVERPELLPKAVEICSDWISRRAVSASASMRSRSRVRRCRTAPAMASSSRRAGRVICSVARR